MNEDPSLMGYLIVGLILAACAFFVLRFIRRVLTRGVLASGCDCCPENKGCDSTQKTPSEHL